MIFCYTIPIMESWQSGNAPDSKSGEPIYIGAQVQILYSPFYKQYLNNFKNTYKPCLNNVCKCFFSFHMF